MSIWNSYCRTSINFVFVEQPETFINITEALMNYHLFSQPGIPVCVIDELMICCLRSL